VRATADCDEGDELGWCVLIGCAERIPFFSFRISVFSKRGLERGGKLWTPLTCRRAAWTVLSRVVLANLKRKWDYHRICWQDVAVLHQ
jgi:hypothetical protein